MNQQPLKMLLGWQVRNNIGENKNVAVVVAVELKKKTHKPMQEEEEERKETKQRPEKIEKSPTKKRSRVIGIKAHKNAKFHSHGQKASKQAAAADFVEVAQVELNAVVVVVCRAELADLSAKPLRKAKLLL